MVAGMAEKVRRSTSFRRFLLLVGLPMVLIAIAISTGYVLLLLV
ncbi:MAG: hypothetical protein AVDCRST_MAG14-1549 [uncultured Rubrobacteraceae bacterium]|uniref:Uncharacterized protein n=1 Tax=uncultured Rubrobacteraceae bacterium TaxID=349277 RepID=A0A6J4R0Q4_9ACTN|nr:MAG: hypothetical protein AVDCRST_MAG14-1549 [uncultured Rubrobacteraceae bacterium]